MNKSFSSDFYQLLLEIEAELSLLEIEDISSLAERRLSSREQKIRKMLALRFENLAAEEKQRAEDEFLGFGPLEGLLRNDQISEILVNGWDNIWCERNGKLERHPDRFISPQSYRMALDKMTEACRTQLSVERPMAHGNLRGFRLQMIGAEITQEQCLISLRRHPRLPWNFQRLQEHRWATPEAFELLRDWLRRKMNFLVIGPTGSGKTSILNACLQELPENCRSLLIEDTRELHPPNAASPAFLTRQDPQNILPEISMSELVRQSLRMRPDRLVLGEIRGPEAKDFLLALSTGHGGSWGTMHASHPHQALIRLEMLVQLGAPHWGLSAIRRLIYLSLQGLILVEKNPEGQRQLRGIYQVCSLEENGLLIEKVWERT